MAQIAAHGGGLPHQVHEAAFAVHWIVGNAEAIRYQPQPEHAAAFVYEAILRFAHRKAPPIDFPQFQRIVNALFYAEPAIIGRLALDSKAVEHGTMAADELIRHRFLVRDWFDLRLRQKRAILEPLEALLADTKSAAKRQGLKGV
ncbi:hypothetical protein GCM10011390_44040 [Aureimonas endophytica]|uniref:Uncharacterized protein n=1 Tax=Aureimonas endophytica TaxID=2027858 RepID=A0A917ECT1_9HYPH|nr:hypothetical protein [Aureimonas endophytica]GGE19971.1 hypothetical protein GCM10011390_44040 [Aureimonas endophytica]